MANNNDELVLLIHGTFAQPEKNKTKWWQIGSNPWKEIQKRLPGGTKLADRKEIFYWSGENQERDRYWTGNELLRRLLRLEKQGRPYHLVGHSHGGSVIWNALQEAVRRRIGKKRPNSRLELPNLRSWTTVGTPFLQYNESMMGRWPGAILSKLFFFVSWGLTIFLAILFYNWHGKIVIEFEQLLRRIGVTNPATVESLSFAVLGVLFLVAGFFGLALHMWVSATRQEALEVRQTEFVRNQAMLDFGDRWLGLWSREDEAIGGLKGSIRLHVQLLPKLEFRPTRVFQYDRRIWTYRILLRWVLAPVLNRFIPMGNNMILSTMSKSAQGDDRPGCNVTSVSEGPICFLDEYQYPTLPEDVDDDLTNAANTQMISKAPNFVPRVRTLLADYSSGVAMLGGGGIKSAGFEFVGDELIHTSYFDHPAVLDLVAHHIQVHCQGNTDATRRNDAIGKWYRSTRENVKKNVTDNPTVKSRSLTFLGKQNRLAPFAVVLSLLALAGSVVLFLESIGNHSSGISILYQVEGCTAVAMLALVLGLISQRRAERGARSRRIAKIAVHLALLWFAILALGPLMIVVDRAMTYFSDVVPAKYVAVVDEIGGRKNAEEEVLAFVPGKEGIANSCYFVTQDRIGLYDTENDGNENGTDNDKDNDGVDDDLISIDFDQIESFQLVLPKRSASYDESRFDLVWQNGHRTIEGFTTRSGLQFYEAIQERVKSKQVAATGSIEIAGSPSPPAAGQP